MYVSEQRRLVHDEYWELPSPPRPFLIHLGITARTHDIRDFQINFPEEYANFYIDRLAKPGTLILTHVYNIESFIYDLTFCSVKTVLTWVQHGSDSYEYSLGTPQMLLILN